MTITNDTTPSPKIAAAPNSLLAELHAAVVEGLGAEAQTLALERAVLGIFFTGVKLANGADGMCATPIKSVPEAVCCPSSAKAISIAGKNNRIGTRIFAAEGATMPGHHHHR